MPIHIIALSGKGNCGKSCTLFEAARALSEHGKMLIQTTGLEGSFLCRIKCDNRNILDLRVVVPVEVNGLTCYVYIATPGDSLEDLQANFDFFDGKTLTPQHHHIYYFAEPDHLRQICWKELAQYPPKVCITACHPNHIGDVQNYAVSHYASFNNIPKHASSPLPPATPTANDIQVRDIVITDILNHLP